MQKINLYLPELRPKKEWLTANTLVLSIGGVLLLLTLFSIQAKMENNNLEAKIVKLEDQQVAARAQLDDLKYRAKPFSVSQLDAKIDALRKTIKSRERVGKIIEFQNLGNSGGFSKNLDAIAHHSKPSFSIDRFVLKNGARMVEIKGKTRQPEDIALYIADLSNADEFKGTTFGRLSVGQKRGVLGTYEYSLGFESLFSLIDDRER